MIAISNQEALRFVKEHEKFPDFLESLDYSSYPGLDLEKVFMWISTGVLVKDMPLESVYRLLREIRAWTSLHSHGGQRPGAGAQKSTKNIVRVTLSAEKRDIERGKHYAKRQGTSLQALFRNWLSEELS